MTVREKLEAAVERAIDALNSYDGDPEAEAEPPEPSGEWEAWEQPAGLG